MFELCTQDFQQMIHRLLFEVGLLNKHLAWSLEHGLCGVETDGFDGIDDPLVDFVGELVQVDVFLVFSLSHFTEYVDGITSQHRSQLDVQSTASDGQAHLLGLEEHLCLAVLIIDGDARHFGGTQCTLDEEFCVRRIVEYKCYSDAIAGKTAAEEESVRIADSLHLITANISNVFRKVSYAAEKDGAKELVKDIARFEAALDAYDLSAEDTADASEIEALWSPLYSAIAGYIQANPAFIKTKSEERLFVDKDALVSEISGLRGSYAAAVKKIAELNGIIESSDAAKTLVELSDRMSELKGTLEKSKNTMAANTESIAALEAEYEPACKGLVESLAALKGKPVELENLPQLSV